MDIVNYQSLLDDSIVPQLVAKLPWGHHSIEAEFALQIINKPIGDYFQQKPANG